MASKQFQKVGIFRGMSLTSAGHDAGTRVRVLPGRTSACVFCLAGFLYFLLRSWDFSAVDGALRAAGGFRESELHLHGNNHMLYPFWIRLWARAMGWIGWQPQDPVGFVRMSQGMNAVMAAGVLGLFHQMLRWVGSDRAAVVGTLMLAFSNAFFAHATNSAEVMPGVFFATVGIYLMVAGIRTGSAWLMTGAGAALALALASYQSMGLMAPIGLLLCSVMVPCGGVGQPGLGHVLRRLTWVALGGVAGICIIYGWAYHSAGIGVAQMPSRFLELPGSGAYGGVKMSRVLNLPLGIVNGFLRCLPEGYRGFRWLMQQEGRLGWYMLMACGAGLVSGFGGLTLVGWKAMSRRIGFRWTVLTGIVGVSLIAPLIGWDPLYDKLLIVPLASMIAVAVAVHGQMERQERGRGSSGWLLTCFAGFQFVACAAWVSDGFRDPKPYLAQAVGVNSMVRSNDWVAVEFDPVSSHWQMLYGAGNPRVTSLPTLRRGDALEWMQRARAACKRGDGRLLFLGVLEVERVDMDMFVTPAGGLRFDDLAEYRRNARELGRFERKASPVRLMEAACEAPSATGLPEPR